MDICVFDCDTHKTDTVDCCRKRVHSHSVVWIVIPEHCLKDLYISKLPEAKLCPTPLVRNQFMNYDVSHLESWYKIIPIRTYHIDSTQKNLNEESVGNLVAFFIYKLNSTLLGKLKEYLHKWRVSKKIWFSLTASPVVSDTDRTEGGRLIFAKFGQCGQHTSQRSPIRSKTIFVTRFGHQEALQFFTI